MKTSIYLESNILRSNLSPKAISLYIALRGLYSGENYIYITPSIIYYELSHKLNLTRYISNTLIDGIYELAEDNYIHILETNKDTFILDISNLNSKNEYFTYIDLSDMRAIFNSSSTINKFSLLKYFAVLIDSLSGTYRVLIDGAYKTKIIGNMPLSHLSKTCGIRYASAIKYNSELERLKLIYVYRQDHKCNIYCNYKYKDYVITYIDTVINHKCTKLNEEDNK